MDDYTEKGKWFGKQYISTNQDENCTNPRLLFKSITDKPEDLFHFITYRYHDGSNSTKFWARLFAKFKIMQ